MRRIYNPTNAYDGLRRGEKDTHFMILYTGGQFKIKYISEYTSIIIDPNIFAVQLDFILSFEKVFTDE